MARPGGAATELRVRLFGRFQPLSDGQPLASLEGLRVRELLGYLLVHRDRPHHREQLASELWGATSTQKSLKHLRHALWQLQSAEAATAHRVTVEGGYVQLDAAGLWLDVAEFERAYARTHGRTGFELDHRGAEALQEAVSLYVADLLLGWDHHWCLLERERLQSVYLSLLDKLMDYAIASHRPEMGLGYGSRSLGLDWARESTHQRLMRLHYAAGDRTAALRQYERCARSLEDELGVRPGRQTRVLYEAIEADRDEHALSLEAAHGVSVGRLADDLKRLQTILNGLQRQVSVALEQTRQGG